MGPVPITFAVLVVLMGTAWGAISLWAATSPLHWAIRLFALVLPLSFFLNVPAYEPILFFASQSLLIAVGVAIRDRCVADQKIRFSLKSLLVATVVASLLLAVGTRTNILSRSTWLSLVAGSTSLGLTTLLAAWKIRWWKKLVVGPVALAIAAVPLGLWDALLLGFPEWDRSAAPNIMGGATATARQFFIAETCGWFAVLLAVYVLLNLIFGFLSLSRGGDRVQWKKWVGHVGMACLLLLMIVPVLAVYLRMPPPETLNRKIAVAKSGYEVLMEVQDHLVENGATDFPNQASDEQLAAAMEKNAQAIALVREASRLPFNPPEDWNIPSLMGHAQLIRGCARVFFADSVLARRQGRLDDVLASALDTIRLAHQTDETTLVTGLVAIAVEARAHHTLARVRSELTSRQAQRLIAELSEIDAHATTIDEVLSAELNWSFRMYGWRRQLFVALSELSGVGDPLETVKAASGEARNRSAVVRRLLLLDLAIMNHQRETNTLPESLGALGLDAPLLIDAFAADGQHISYEPAEDSFKLYSVGPDGVDNGGDPIGDHEWTGDGDYLLDSLFAEEPVKATE